MYKLSDIFKTDNIEQKRKILSNFPITREDRNKTLAVSVREPSLSKGKKILSEYYYIDYFKIITEGTEDARLYLGMVIDFISNDSFIEDEWYGVPTEVGDIIFKVKYDNDYVYMYDNVALGSGTNAAALAIRKYCKIKTPDSTVLKAHINDYVPVFLGTALFIAPLGSGGSPEDLLPIVNNTYKTIISTLSPYFISEEEFWNEANIVENAEIVLNDWFSQE